jgi:hypothetical protein
MGTHIFANLFGANPSFDPASAMQLVEPSNDPLLTSKVKEAMEALLDLYRQKSGSEDSGGFPGDAPDADLSGDGSTV